MGDDARIALVAMPWATSNRPSAALSALAPYVARELGLAVDTWNLYLRLAQQVGLAAYETLAARAPTVGELLFTSLFYPESMPRVREHFMETILHPSALRREDLNAGIFTARNGMGLFLQLRTLLDRIVDEAARDLARYTVVGLTTSFGQLFANLVLARAIKRRSPATPIVLGGSTVSGPVGPSLLREYDCVDFVVQGEGEIPLVGLLRHLLSPGSSPPGGRETGMPTYGPGIVSRDDLDAYPKGVPLAQVTDLDRLPHPDYDAFARAAEKTAMPWVLPVEGSRGCWWACGRGPAQPRRGCHFCNLNVQWEGYREKSVDRLAREVDALVGRYSNSLVFFADNIVRARGVEAMASALAGLRRNLHCFHEIRAHLSPYEILCLRDMGVARVQVGIEALSPSLLRRLHKGTTVIQNLQAMKTCRELGIANFANLMLDFPGSTTAEVEETCDAIERYAVAYEPLEETRFLLGTGSTVEMLPQDYQVTHLRNAEHWKIGLPDEVFHRLVMLDRAADHPGADWNPVRQALQRWRKRYNEALGSPWTAGLVLFYLDGGSFVRIHDARTAPHQYPLLEGLERELFLHCCQIRHRNALMRRFAAHPPARVLSSLERMVQHAWVYREGERYLTTVPAGDPRAAAGRIRAQHEHGTGGPSTRFTAQGPDGAG